MTPSGVVTLLTDFGTREPFVGVMKGVILKSFGELELFVRNGSAAAVLSAERGTPVGVSW